MKPTLKLTAAIIAICAIASPAEAAGRWSRDRAIVQPKAAANAMPAPPVPGVPNATPQYRREYARVKAMLARNPDAFGGFNTTNTLDELRAQVDRNIAARHVNELAGATTPAERDRLTAAHKAFWAGLAARREIRTRFTDEQNIVHSLMMILTTKAKLK